MIWRFMDNTDWMTTFFFDFFLRLRFLAATNPPNASVTDFFRPKHASGSTKQSESEQSTHAPIPSDVF
jgi:hypothetical protein